jgi:hypothetical protein
MQKRQKLHLFIAAYTRVWRLTALIGRDKIVNDRSLKFLFIIRDEKWDSQVRADHTSVLQVTRAAAATSGRTDRTFGVVKPHRNANHFMALLDEESGTSCTIYTAR